MAKQQDTGVYQLQNGNWAFRFKVVVNGDPVYKKCSKDEWGEPLKNKRAAIKARKQAIKAEKANEGQIASQTPTQIPVLSKTIAEVYAEYCEKGRKDRAFQTIRKQDSLWENHLRARFGDRKIDSITTAEVQDYLSALYYEDGYAYMYVEGFLKMFYLLFGQAYYAMKMEGISLIKHRKIEKKQTEFMRGDREMTMGNKSKVVAALLAFFLGTTGAHRYYLGYKKQGIIQTCGLVSFILGWVIYVPAMISENVASLLFALIFLIYGGITSIWAFVDFIRILTGRLKPEDGSDYTENQPRQVQVIQTSPSAKDNIDALEKLARLHEQGVLTDEEFEQKKKDILEKM